MKNLLPDLFNVILQCTLPVHFVDGVHCFERGQRTRVEVQMGNWLAASEDRLDELIVDVAELGNSTCPRLACFKGLVAGVRAHDPRFSVRAVGVEADGSRGSRKWSALRPRLLNLHLRIIFLGVVFETLN